MKTELSRRLKTGTRNLMPTVKALLSLRGGWGRGGGFSASKRQGGLIETGGLFQIIKFNENPNEFLAKFFLDRWLIGTKMVRVPITE